MKKTINKPKENNTVTVLKQWLSYALWFWTLFVISTILAGALSYYIVGAYDSAWLIYFVSSLFVLIPAATVAERIYGQVEPEKKAGFESAVLVIHAVIACLIGVGSLITAVISLVSTLIDPGNIETKLTTVLSASLIAGLAFLFFAKITQLKRLRLINKRFHLIIITISVLAVVSIATGPLVDVLKRQNDRAIEQNYYFITNDIYNHSTTAKKLPENIKDITLSDNSKKALDTGRVTYNSMPSLSENHSHIEDPDPTSESQLAYELCVEWEYEKTHPYNSYAYAANEMYFDGASHQKGNQCYIEYVYLY